SLFILGLMTCLALHGSHFQLYLQDNTSWKPDSCQDCRCRSGVVTCEPTLCKPPQCDFQKGEVLQIASNKCCPKCASRAEGFCQHEGQTHSHGTQWASSGCVQCSCAHGKVTCSPRSCPALTCAQGELQDTAQGSCCPKCVGPGEPCSFDGRVFQDGEGWSLGRCSRCVCRDGATQCSTASCQPLLCSQGENKVRRPGKCCEECVPSKGSCLDGSTIRYHGEMWNSSHCDFCVCQEGQITCRGAECAKVDCAKTLEEPALVLWNPLKTLSQGRGANLEFLMQVCTVGFHCKANQCESVTDLSWIPSHAVSVCCNVELDTQRIPW
uniref:VWFC domain-containing protein n=1 Tax=Malurus cyaneus samueli TaxID=2593467 RepID=A0A8C5X6E5_9PASS